MKRRTIVFVLALFAIGVVISAGLNRLESLRPVQVNSFNPAGPQRVICAAPNIVEIVYALGQQDRIAGVSNYANYPPEARLKESIGGVIDPNTERILALKPDLIIAQGAMEKLAALC